MIAITGTTESLEVKLNAAAATTELPITAAFVDIDQSTLALVGATAFQGITTGSTPVVLSAVPGASVERRLNALTIVNVDTAAAVVTVQVDVSAVKRQAFKITLAAGDQLVVTNAGIDVLDSGGNKKQTVVWPTLTNHGVALGQGTGPLAATAAGAVNTVLHGAGASADPTFSTVVEADQTLADNTTNDATTSKHGYVPKAPNDTGKFWRGDATYNYPKERVSATTSSSTPTPNADTDDLYDVTALATAPTFGAPTGTPRNSQKLIIRIKDNGTIRALSWNAAYVAGGVSLPTTTVASKILTIGFMYNTANGLNKWCCLASAQEA